MNLRREAVLLAALIVLLLLPLFGVSGFYTWPNLRGLLLDIVPVLIAAGGMTYVIVAGQIDISIGSQLVVAGITSGLLAKAGLPMPVVALGTLASGALMGLLNGLLVQAVRIPAIIATLATMVLLRSGVQQATGGDWISGLPPSYPWFGLGQTLAQPLYVIVAVALFAALAWIARFTTVGRSFYAVGCDPEAARRLGVPAERTLVGAFVVMGLCVGLAALMNFTRYPSIETNAGLGFEMKVIAAVVVGGASITGGRGTFSGTLLGVLLLGTIGTVLTFLHVNPAWEKAIQGAVLLIAVVGGLSRRKGGRHE